MDRSESVTEAQVRDALKVVQDPDLHQDIVSLGFVKSVTVSDGTVALRIELTTPACPVKDQLKKEAHDAVARLPGVRAVDVEMTAVVRGSTAIRAAPTRKCSSRKSRASSSSLWTSAPAISPAEVPRLSLLTM